MSSTLQVVKGDSVPSLAELPRVPKPKSISESMLAEAEEALRKEAKALVREIEKKYWDLGRVLYDVYDGVPGGYRSLMSGDGALTKRQALFNKWGYNSFGEYCEREVGIRRRTGENIRYAYYWFSIHLDVNTGILNKVRALGRSKVYQLAGFVNSQNIEEWIKRAESLTFDELVKAIKQAKAVAAVADDEERGHEVPDEKSATPDAKPLPKPEELHVLQTSLYEGQWQTWQAAFERAKSISKSDKIGHNLELICQDFLMNNDFGKTPEGDIEGFLKKIERNLGVFLVAVDPSTGETIHNRDLLWRLTQESSEKSDE